MAKHKKDKPRKQGKIFSYAFSLFRGTRSFRNHVCLMSEKDVYLNFDYDDVAKLVVEWMERASPGQMLHIPQQDSFMVCNNEAEEYIQTIARPDSPLTLVSGLTPDEDEEEPVDYSDCDEEEDVEEEEDSDEDEPEDEDDIDSERPFVIVSELVDLSMVKLKKIPKDKKHFYEDLFFTGRSGRETAWSSNLHEAHRFYSWDEAEYMREELTTPQYHELPKVISLKKAKLLGY